MAFKNTKDTYGVAAKFFHWAIAFIILTLIVVGLYMGDMPYSPQKLEIYALHKSFGLLVLWLAGLRILWRFHTKPPQALETHQKWEKTLAKITHIFLYFTMFAMPLSGWLMSSAGEHPVPFFGLQMPDIASKNEDLAKFGHQFHTIIAYILIAAIGFHSLGAFKHHVIDGDMTLKRMLPIRGYVIWPIILIGVLIIFCLGVIKFGLLGNEKQKTENVKTSEMKSLEIKIISNPYQWNIVKEQSQIEFSSSVYKKNFKGSLSDFDGTIIFNPDDLAVSKADIEINLKSLNSGDAERDSQMLGADWFKIADYPLAYFESIEFQQGEEGRYIVVGNLTLAGKTMPVTMPFTLDIVDDTEGDRAYVEGALELDRLDFGLGGERWESADLVGHKVAVAIRLVAEKPKNSAN